MTEKMSFGFASTLSISLVFSTLLCCNGQQIPNDLRKRMARMSPAEYIDQLVRLPRNGPLSANSSCQTGSQGQECSSSGRLPGNIRDTLVANIAQPDFCGPHLVTVPVPLDPDPAVVTFPTCVLMYRCAGCTGLDHEECAPVDITYAPLKILYTRYSVQGSDNMDYNNMKTVYVEKHLSCESRCKVQPEDCHDDVHSHHDNDNCRCICRNAEEESMCVTPKQWDGSRCECVCPLVLNCDTRRYSFNTDTCRCERRSLSSARGLQTSATDPDEINTRGLDESAVEHLRAMIGGTTVSSTTAETTEPSTTTATNTATTTATTTDTTTATTTSTTTTTTAESTTRAQLTEEDCASTVCGDFWQPGLLTNGLCGCKPAFDFTFPGKK